MKMPIEKKHMSLLKYIRLHTTRHFSIIGSPYGLKESINWCVKHIVIDTYYTFVLVYSFLCFISVRYTHIRWVIIDNVILAAFILLFIYRRYQRYKNKIKNIGILNEDGWREYKLNQLNSSYKILNIAFVGDIMRMRDYNIKFEEHLIEFFKGVDLVIGNLEGVITNKRRKINPQNHSEIILKQLQLLKIAPQKWLLCLSNNHAADYHLEDLKRTLFILKKKKYYFFGTNSSPFFKFHHINIVAGTMWSNRKDNGFFTWFKNIDKHYDAKRFNILFPHWHFENECYVRKKFQKRSINLINKGIYMSDIRVRLKEILKSLNFNKILRRLPIYQQLKEIRNKSRITPNWDLIYGHHTHMPQPITVYNNKLLVYSGGNFINSQCRKKHRSGLIMKCQIGRSRNTGKYSIGNVEWSYTINQKEKNHKKVTVIIDLERNRKNYYKNQANKFKTALLVNISFLGFWICYFYIFINFGIIFLLLYIQVCIFIPIMVLYFKNKSNSMKKKIYF
ncbi:MAG: CapA family protein [Promethearchaeota archaeon]